MTFTDRVSTVTREHIVPSVIDAVFEENVLAKRLLQNPEPWNGRTYDVPIALSQNTAGGPYDGFDTFDVSAQQTRKKLSFTPTGRYQTVALSGMDIATSETEAGIIDLVGQEMEEAKLALADGIGSDFYGDGSGSKNFAGLKQLVDDDHVSVNYGGLNRNTYPNLQSYYNDLGGSITLSALSTALDDVSYGTDVPSIGVTTKSIWSDIEALYQASLSGNFPAAGMTNSTSMGADLGMSAIWYRQVPIIADDKCTDNDLYFLNEKYIKFIALDRTNEMMEGTTSMEGTPSTQKIGAFNWTGWRKPVNQDSVVGYFLINGQLINKNPSRSARITGIT